MRFGLILIYLGDFSSEDSKVCWCTLSFCTVEVHHDCSPSSYETYQMIALQAHPFSGVVCLKLILVAIAVKFEALVK